MSQLTKQIVFFDGVCSFCNSSVDFLVKIDRHQRLQFASLQGETAKELLNAEQLKTFNSIIFYRNGNCYTSSKAIIAIGNSLGGGWKWLAIMASVIPTKWRDALYNWIARNRYKWFGQRETCRMPSPEEADRILP